MKLQYFFQIRKAVLVRQLFDGGVAELFAQVLKQGRKILHALQIIRGMADAVKVAAEAQVVVAAHDIHHIR